MYVEMGTLLNSYVYEDAAVFFRLCFGINNVKPNKKLQPYANSLGFWTDTSAYTVTRLNALIAFLGKGNYMLHAVFWQLFSMLGLLALFKTFYHFYPAEKRLLIFGVFFIPSVVFWFSGVHKEALSICAIGLLSWSVVNLHLKKKTYFLYLTTFLFLFILGLIRLYLLLILLPSALIFYFTLFKNKYLFLKYVGFFSLLLLVGFMVGNIKPSLHFMNKFIEIQHFFEHYASGSSDIPIKKLEVSFKSLVINTPNALYQSICRPTFFDVTKQNFWMKLPAAVETLFIICLMIAAFISKGWKVIFKEPLLLYCLVVSILYLVLIGLLIPNLGALFRYKSVVLPLLVPCLFLAIKDTSLAKWTGSRFGKLIRPTEV